MISRVFTQQEVDAYARATGDFNPIHLDPIRARRMIFNRPVVHGLMLVAWTLDNLLQHRPRIRTGIQHLRATFDRPVTVGDTAHLEVEGIWPAFKFRIRTLNASAVRGAVSFSDIGPGGPRRELREFPRREPDEPDPAAYPRAAGMELLELGLGAINLFPSLGRALAPAHLAILAATTRLVGMRCPGMRSILSEVDLQFTGDDASTADWHVVDFDARFGRAVIALESPAFRGEIIAFERPVGAPDPSDNTAPRPRPDEFANVAALVVGATRGLGAAISRQLVSGGASVLGTFHLGSHEAAELTSELKDRPGTIRFEHLNVFDDAWPLLESATGRDSFTHLIYAATPPIFVGTKGVFSRETFELFSKAYVHQFLNLFEAVRGAHPRLQAVLFPSSVAVEKPPPAMTEYAMAKAAAELLITSLSARYPTIRFLVPRLPRLNTDQTINRSAIAAEPPLPLALELLRQLQS